MYIKLTFGPPGTGKTKRNMGLLGEELKHNVPEEIAYISFTKEGAEQGISRAIILFNLDRERFIYARTLHSLAYKELKLSRNSVISKWHYKEFSNKLGMNFTGYYTEELKNDDDKYLFYDSLYRNNKKTALLYLNELDAKKLEYVQKNYKEFKRSYDVLDFTDMIELFNKYNIKVPVKKVFIDEAQDLTTLQWEMVLTAFSDCDTMYIAGDDDQAIYQWSGADIDYFLGIKGEIEILKHSYRLPDNILNMSKSISNQITKRVKKEYTGIGKNGRIEFTNNIEDIIINNEESYMFLSRNHTFLYNVEQFLRKKGLIYYKDRKLSANKYDIDIIKLYETERKNKVIRDSVYEKIKSNLKENFNLALPWYESFNWESDKLEYYRDIIKNKSDINKCNITVSTIHSVKGGEADNVVLLLDITRTTKNNLEINPDSEHRVFYVGVTRAKKNIYIVYANSKYQYDIYYKE